MEPSDQSKAFYWKELFDREEIKDFWKLSSITCKKYAEKYGFDYFFDNPNEDDYKPYLFNAPAFERFKVFQYLKEYDVVIWVDSDVLINPDADNIVEKYSDDSFCQYSNIVVNTNMGDKALYNDKISLKKVGYANTGVFICYRDSRFMDLYEQVNYNKVCGIVYDDYWWKHLDKHYCNVTKLENGEYNTEDFMGYLINHMSIHANHLDRKYNYQVSHKIKIDTSLILKQSSQFLHFSLDTKKYMKEYFNLIENMI